ncbi:hypothetical protein AURDEDRAFT_110609 [Auricularia subglabra TFB-10046 SS5]|nr:hypothetical protein AURDEDRAFT_110609 [Auricularia subglabra TFB-10046 SS5]
MAALLARPLLRTSHHCRRNISLTAVAGDGLPTGGESSRDRWRWWHEQKASQLVSSLRDPSTPPSRVWAYYNDYFTHGLPRDLALEVHQQVLRRCVAPWQAVRKGAAARLRERYGRDARHIYETRLQTVIRAIRDAGEQPALEDYNFVLAQFAAAGYQSGAWRIFDELARAGLEPNARTYGLCLQAVAHRLDLPCAKSLRRQMVDEATKICDDVLKDMSNRGFSAHSIHVDLCLRILRTTGDQDAFMNLLKQAYGIDLQNPDCFPLTASDNSLRSLASSEPATRPDLLPFSVHVLNTVVNFLGTHGRVSEMILAYEVLTNPLPTPRAGGAAQFDEDDDAHAFYDLSGSGAPARELPSCAPNTTTFIFLIRHLARLRKFALVRHYLLDALRMERDMDNRLRLELATKALDEVAPPKVHVRKSALEAVLGLGNTSRSLSLLRWLWRQTKWTLESKRARLKYFYTLQGDIFRSEALDEYTADVLTEAEFDFEENSMALEAINTATAPRKRDALEANAEPWRPPSALHDPLPFFSRAPLPASIDLDLDAPSPEFSSRTSPNVFDAQVHIALLEKDAKEIHELLARVRRAVWRLTTRRKEWLGRRVWAGKTIYLASEGRVVVDRQRWSQIARFAEPGKLGHRAGQVRPAAPDKTRPFRLPPAHHHEGVDEQFVNKETFGRRPHVRWR